MEPDLKLSNPENAYERGRNGGAMKSSATTKVGVDLLLSGHELPGNIRDFALVANQTAVAQGLRWSVYELWRSMGSRLKLLLAPGHGLYGDRNGEVDERMVDVKTGLPVLRLGGYIRDGLPADLRDVTFDAIVWDLQDAGVRQFIFWVELTRAMQHVAKEGKTIVVLDRPNPIGGTKFNGPITDQAFRDYLFGGLKVPIPITHGLTMGEFALLINEALGIRCQLHVIKMKGWKRQMTFRDTGLSWVPLTPNLPTPETVTVYPGTSLLEGTNVSEGRGTTKPFEMVGAPWIKGYDMAEKLNSAKVPGAIFREVHFIPMQHPEFPMSTKHAAKRCAGVQVHVVDPREFDPVRAGLEILSYLKRECEDHFLWDSSHFFRNKPVPKGVFFFDTLAGTPKVRESLEAGEGACEIMASWQDDLREYSRVRKKYLLY
jgi:uncharacterized protein YbbC (DUF1343 family)